LILTAVLPPRFAYVAKEELLRKPLAGIPLRRLASAFVERFDNARGVEDTRALEARVKRGDALVFFPEGTFRDAPGLLPFRMGAFVIAANSRIPVVPLTLTGTRALLPGERGRPTMEQLGETPERMARAYRRAGRSTTMPWLDALDETQRAAFREHGSAIARQLLAALDASTVTDRAAHLATASEAAAEYGVAAAQRGLGVTATVETFLRFRRPFVAELLGVARRRGRGGTAGCARC